MVVSQVKIGSVAPDIIHRNVKTCRENIRNLHILAPEWADDSVMPDTPVDIYAFGMCALETAALEINSRFEHNQLPLSLAMGDNSFDRAYSRAHGY